MKKIKIFIKKHYILGSLVALILALIVVPKSIELLLQSIPGTGSNDGWLGFWGGYLGSMIAVAFAAYTAKLQSEKAIDENRKAELTVYHDKAKLDKIFKIQEELIEIYDSIKSLPVMTDTVEKIAEAEKNIRIIGEKVGIVNGDIKKLQFYIDRKGVDFPSYKKTLSLIADNESENILEEVLGKRESEDIFKVWYGGYQSLRVEIREFNERYIEQQIRNLNELISISRNSIK